MYLPTSQSSRLQTLAPFLPFAAGLIVLAPPAHHYGYYSSVREELYDFVTGFHAAASEAGEQVCCVFVCWAFWCT